MSKLKWCKAYLPNFILQNVTQILHFRYIYTKVLKENK